MEASIWQNDEEQSVTCTHSPYLVVIAYILTVYQSINAKRSPHALYQNMRTSLAHLAGFEPTACRLGGEKSVLLRCPPTCRKCLILLGF